MQLGTWKRNFYMKMVTRRKGCYTAKHTKYYYVIEEIIVGPASGYLVVFEGYLKGMNVRFSVLPGESLQATWSLFSWLFALTWSLEGY